MAAALRDAGFTDVRVHSLPLQPVDAACAVATWPGPPPETPPRLRS
jgi:hypothetical protein